MDLWSPWSAWAYDERQQFMYRIRQDSNGNLDYDYNYETPRDSGDVAGITQTLGNTRLSPSSSSYEQQPPDSPENYVVASHKEKERTKPSKSKSKDKDRSSKERSGGGGGGGGSSSSSKHYSHDKSSSYRKGYGGSSASASSHSHGSSSMPPQQSSHPPSYDQSQYSYDSQKYDLPGGYQTPDASYASTQASGYATTDNQQPPPRGYDDSQNLPFGMGQTAAGPSDLNYSVSAHTYEQEDDGALTPRNHIAADGEEEIDQMDPRYRVEHSSKFEPGAIFKVLWSEPQGSSDGQKHPSVSGKQEVQNRFGMRFHVGFRRFIVIANDHGHCTCVPILTYGGRGCKKSGVKPNKHGIVYETGQRPRQVEGEPRLGFHAVQVYLTEGEKLSRESRVNYSKLVTVEHNVSVFFIGCVVQDSWPTVEDAVNQCWDQKVHHRRLKHER